MIWLCGAPIEVGKYASPIVLTHIDGVVGSMAQSKIYLE